MRGKRGPSRPVEQLQPSLPILAEAPVPVLSVCCLEAAGCASSLTSCTCLLLRARKCLPNGGATAFPPRLGLADCLRTCSDPGWDCSLASGKVVGGQSGSPEVCSGSDGERTLFILKMIENQILPFTV